MVGEYFYYNVNLSGTIDVGAVDSRWLPRAWMAVRRRAAGSDSILEMFVDAIRYQKLRVFRPSVRALGQPYLFIAERLAVRFCGVLLVGRAVPDVAIQNDQGGTARVVAGLPLDEDDRPHALGQRPRRRRRGARLVRAG